MFLSSEILRKKRNLQLKIDEEIQELMHELKSLEDFLEEQEQDIKFASKDIENQISQVSQKKISSGLMNTKEIMPHYDILLSERKKTIFQDLEQEEIKIK